MPIDIELRSKGVGASEVAAVLNLDTYRDAFSVYADKVGDLPRTPSTARQRRGKYLEQSIVNWYSGETGAVTLWTDETRSNPQRSWQVFTPDAWVLEAPGDHPVFIGGVDAKTAGIGAHDEWGESGSDLMPLRVTLQCQWSCSAAGLPWWDVACLCSLDDLRIYRVHHDPAVETILLEEVDRFWRENVLARVPPVPTYRATDALKRMYPKNVQAIRAATDEEIGIVAMLRQAKVAEKEAEARLAGLENRIKLAIGDADGILAGADRISWKKEKDSTGTAWEKIARQTCMDEQRLAELIADNQIVTRVGARKLLVPRSWTKE